MKPLNQAASGNGPMALPFHGVRLGRAVPEPMPEVILRWRNGRYIPAADLMAKPAPTQAKLEGLAASIRQSAEWDAQSCSVPEALWTNAIALMYSGHEQLGWKFVDLGWKVGFPGNGVTKEYLIDNGLRARLEESIYWPELHMQQSRTTPCIQGEQVVAHFEQEGICCGSSRTEPCIERDAGSGGTSPRPAS